MSDEIVWEDPPPSKTGKRGEWSERLQPLIARPGNWAKVRSYKSLSQAGGVVTRLRTGTLQIPLGRWEFTGRQLEGSYVVYARYLGPKEGES